MAKTWSADNPKAALMARKRAVIVDAALKAFLDAGYAEASVNQIAATAGVSIKTLYRHFESKDDLFSAVMQAACGKMPDAEQDDLESHLSACNVCQHRAAALPAADTLVGLLATTYAQRSAVALTPVDAQRLGLDLASLHYDRPVVTANGQTKAAAVTLAHITVAGARVDDVNALVVREGLSTSLLGMSYLGRLSRFEATKTALILRP